MYDTQTYIYEYFMSLGHPGSNTWLNILLLIPIFLLLFQILTGQTNIQHPQLSKIKKKKEKESNTSPLKHNC